MNLLLLLLCRNPGTVRNICRISVSCSCLWTWTHMLLKFKVFLWKKLISKFYNVVIFFFDVLSEVGEYYGLWKQNRLYWHNINNFNVLSVVFSAEMDLYVCLQIPDSTQEWRTVYGVPQNREKLADLQTHWSPQLDSQSVAFLSDWFSTFGAQYAATK